MAKGDENVSKVFVGAKEAAAMLNVSMPTFYQLAHSDGFPSARVGKRILVNVDGLRRWADEQCQNSIN